ncbi:outer membrane protein assembly factor BamB family protein [Paractinoplanes lichenicola]|uniref:PQQ-binding-like beta-propeller repeat protein n=1 Tax=Paractinoplanes lichenicola TaxID=2802976 RepID=A0ABS1W063_9ACTN|nr:PQQ-binding-like beta-propeller repeat protein [Actinoplanes lichenicola]MBL7260123.1 PQQ-binding-like beta-propeller repeat protein [Actinoplanes lichenicola]
MTLIDLGDAETAAEPAAAPINLPRLRRLALAVLTALGLAAMTASTPPAPPLVRPLWTTALQPSDTVAADSRTVYLNRSSPSGRAEVIAYDLRTGRPRWSTPTGDAYGIRPVGDVVLVTTGPPPTGSPGPRTIALDAGTGRRLWQSTGASSSSAGDQVLLAEIGRAGATTALRLVGLRDGRQLWRRSITPTEEWTTIIEAGRPTAVVTVTGAGDATVYNYDDGAVRHRSRIPWTGVYSATLFSAGAQLVVIRTASAQTAATIYRAADLQPLWRSDELIGYVTGCGPLICTAGVRGVTGRDPVTGDQTWRRDDLNFVWDPGAGRLLLSASANLASATTVLVDAATGRTIGRPLGGQEAFVAGPANSLILLRATGVPDDRTAVTRLDLTDGRQTALGKLDRLTEQKCQGVPGYLLCPSGDTLTVAAVS